MSMQPAASAVNRFGLGAMPGELQQAGDARGWLHAQLRATPDSRAFAQLPDSLTLLQQEAEYRQARRQQKNDGGTTRAAPGNPRRRRMQAMSAPAVQDARPDATAADAQPANRRQLYQVGLADIGARYRVAATTSQPFVERLVRFWSNHFAVSLDKGQARLYAAPMEREAIRPHVLGRFEDLLFAVESHPAMLRYLDNVASVGNDSLLVQRQQRRAQRLDAMEGGVPKPPRQLGLNENLAREIMELHTLGVHGGYSQGDVTEFARALTGWGVPQPRELPDARNAFVFRDVAHEPGTRRILGRSYAQSGEAQGRAILHDLALHPATATHLATKLARHVVSDAPPDALVQRMAKAYLASGGELVALYGALIDDDASWSPDARKFKTPDDFVVSAMRAGGFFLDKRPNELPNLLRELGQPVFTPRSPAGFPDTANDWVAGDALRKRLQIAGAFANQVGGTQAPLDFARAALGADAVGGAFATALGRAGSPQDGYALLFASPAFQWRI